MKRLLTMAAAALVASVLAAPTLANAPTVTETTFTFDDVDPCTGAIHTVTFQTTERRHEHDGRVVVHFADTITTTAGYVGRGIVAEVGNGQVFKFVLRHMLGNPNGNRIQVRVTLQIDLRTGEVRTDDFVLRCVGN
jgi:hypothetical protein